jgi:hypothetical protein
MYRSLGGIAPASPGYGTVKIAPQISKTKDPASANATVSTVRGKVRSAWKRHDDNDELIMNDVSISDLAAAKPQHSMHEEDPPLAAARVACLGRAGGNVTSSGVRRVVTMWVSVPVGMLGEVEVPLLGHDPDRVTLLARETTTTSTSSAKNVGLTATIWAGGPAAHVGASAGGSDASGVVWLRSAPRAEAALGNTDSEEAAGGGVVITLETTAAQLELSAFLCL